MLGLALLRVNVVISLIVSALVGGLMAGLSMHDTIKAFESGLGNGATTALSYAMLGTFAVAISRSGITDLLAATLIKKIRAKPSTSASKMATRSLKYSILSLLLLLSICSQNVIPIHIAFIPLVIPPLLHIFAKLKLDRRLIACVLTFGLITPYMVIPVGFGGIFIENILLPNLNQNGLTVTLAQIPMAMLLPAIGMFFGLLIAVLFSYRAPRDYDEQKILAIEPESSSINITHVYIAITAIILGLATQISTGSMIIGALVGFSVFVISGTIKWDQTQDVFIQGINMMALIGFIMIAAAGFAAVMKASGGIESLVLSLSFAIGDNKPLAALLMLLVGLMITMGIGSSFSTIPIIAAIYVPLCQSFGFSDMATIALVGTAAALGDAGSPASDSTLGPTSGLNADGQHEHIWQSVVPTFIHYNLPLIGFGWLAAMWF